MRRLEQVRKWNEAEKNYNQSTNKIPQQRVQFEDCVTLLEAAARDDYIEGSHVLIK